MKKTTIAKTLENFGFVKSKKALAAVGRSRGDLSDAYGRASDAKKEIWRDLKVRENALCGWDLRVVGCNCHFFTAGFDFVDDNGRDCVAFVTPAHNYYCEK